MEIKNGDNFISLDFKCCLTDSTFQPALEMDDPANAVEILLDFSVKGCGWGVVGDEYFSTTDILALSVGFQNILSGRADTFTFSGNFPYKNCGTPNPFYTFIVGRKGNEILFYLRIHDRLMEYVSVTEEMDVPRFQEIVSEFSQLAERFPPRVEDTKNYWMLANKVTPETDDDE